MVSQPQNKNNRKIRNFFKKIFKKSKKGQDQAYGEVKECELDAWPPHDELGGSTLEILQADSGKASGISDKKNSDDRLKSGGRAEKENEKGKEKELSRKEKNSKGRKLLVLEVNRQDNKLTTKVYDEIKDGAALDHNSNGAGQSLDRSGRRPQPASSYEQLDAALDDLFHQVDRSSAVLVGVEAPPRSQPEPEQLNRRNNKGAEVKDSNLNVLRRRGVKSRAPSPPTKDTEVEGHGSRSQDTSQDTDNEANNSALGLEDSSDNKEIGSLEVREKETRNKKGNRWSNKFQLLKADTTDAAGTGMLLEDVSAEDKKKKKKKKKDKKSSKTEQKCNTPTSAGSLDNGSPLRDSGFAWKEVELREKDNNEGNKQKERKALFNKQKSKRSGNYTSFEYDNKKTPQDDNSAKKVKNKSKISVPKLLKKHEDKRRRELAEEERRTVQGSPRIRLPIRNLDGRSIEILDMIDNSYESPADSARKRLISEGEETEQKNEAKNKKNKKKNRTKEKRTDSVTSPPEEAPQVRRVHTAVPDTATPGCSGTGTSGDKEPLTEPSRLSVRQVGQSVWGACKSGWKYMRAGLVLFAGSPAASVSTAGIVNSHENQSHRSSYGIYH